MRILIYISIIAALSGCGSGEPAPGSSDGDRQTRRFQMGFTPWLYEASVTAQNLVFDQIQTSGDIISHHLMGGIPWQQALDQTPYPANVENDLTVRLNKTVAGKSVYLSIDSLTGLRDSLALNWGESENEPRPGFWARRSFNSAEVIEAYGNFALDMIDRFQPDYFNYGVEISGLMRNSEAEYEKFVVFARKIHERIKAVHPDLPLLVSLELKTPGNAEMRRVAELFREIADYVDIVGISIYPYLFFEHDNKGDPANLPTDWLSQVSELAPGKPVAITEVAWAAEDLLIPALGIDVSATAGYQYAFMQELFSSATALDALFLIWFCLYDYDTLWLNELARGDIARFWRDTGLYDENLNARASQSLWESWYRREWERQ